MADDRPPFGHARHADGQGDGDRGGQAFRDGANRQCDGGHEHGKGGFAAGQADGESEGRQATNRPQQPVGKTGHLAGQRRHQIGGGGDQAGDAAGFGGIAGGDHQTTALPADHRGAGIGHVVALGERGVGGERGGLLAHRLRFAGEQRIVGAQFMLLDEAQIGRQAIAGGKQDDIAGNQLAGVELLAMARPADRYRGRHAARQRSQRPFGLGFLPIADQCIDQHDAEDDAGVDPFAEHRGDQPGGHQDEDQGLRQLGGKAAPGRLAWTLAQAIRAMSRQALGRFGIGQTLRAVHAEACRSSLMAGGMPG